MFKKWTNLVKNKAEIQIPVILASESPRRKAMLSELNIPFQAFHSRIDETLKATDPSKAARDLAVRKVKACGRKDALVIGMDSLVIIGKKILGKPSDAADAEQMLNLLNGKKHRVVTGVAISFQGRIVSESEATDVYFRKLKPSEIQWYVETGEPFGKAGGYAIQGLGRILIRKIEGCYYNVLGFPVYAFQRTLARFGISIHDLV